MIWRFFSKSILIGTLQITHSSVLNCGGKFHESLNSVALTCSSDVSDPPLKSMTEQTSCCREGHLTTSSWEQYL
uniref:Secreted protein n=1 Tax=Physcomitrium patens TaxID=3218 RepID=A0A7I4EUW8_PHYPA